VKRRAFAIGTAALTACALVGFAAAFAVASTGAGIDADTATTTTTAPPTTTEPPPTVPPPPPRLVPIAAGVTVGDVVVGGLAPYRATELVSHAFARPLTLVLSTRQIRLAPSAVGARALVEKAIRRARVARPGATVPLDVVVSRPRIRRFLARLGRGFDSKAVDARVVLRGATPRATRSSEGQHLRRPQNALAIRIALKTHSRDPVELEFDVLKPEVTERNLGGAVVILRDSNKLRFFVNAKLRRTFGVATGQSAYPTPLGSFEIVTLQRNPWWYPPPSPWAADEDPVPPGPGNPLGTRWMGLSEPYVGIHGTPDAASIGYAASHGCIRMRIPVAEWLFQHVKVGTPVFIVSR
jgi:lipoprotein-anchoring transpeptidase ErfK/SrfK